MIYKTSLDKLAKGVTIGVTILFAVLIAISIIIILTDRDTGIPILIIITLLIFYFILFGLRPINYKLTNDKIIIHRIFRDVKIYRTQIGSIQFLDKEKLNGTTRTFAAGGIFGYYGEFFSNSLGKMTWYATRMDKAILISTIDNKKIILTPNEPEKFITDYIA